MGNKYFLSLSPSSNFRASLLQVDGATTFFNVILLKQDHIFPGIMTAKENAFLSDTHQPIAKNETIYIWDLLTCSRSDKRENGRKSATRTYVRHVSNVRQPSGARCRAFSLCLINANKFVQLSVSDLMTICLKIWAKPLDKRAKRYTSSCRRSLACLFLLFNTNDGSAKAGGGGKVSPRKSVVQSACQYDVTSRVSDFQNGEQSVHRRDG